MSVATGWDLPREVRARFSDQLGRQRAIVQADHIIMVLHKVPVPGRAERHGVLFWRKPDGSWEYNERGAAMDMLSKLVGEYGEAMARLEESHDKAQDAEDWFEILEEVGPICRASRNLFESIQRAREAITDPSQGNELLDACDLANEVVRTSELLSADARNALEFRIAKQAEVQEKLSRERATASHRLNIMAAIFFPIATLASVFGMNLTHGLENSPTWVFWVVLLAGIVLGVVIIGYLTRVEKRETPRTG